MVDFVIAGADYSDIRIAYMSPVATPFEALDDLIYHAWGFRRLMPRYDDPIITLRRSTDDATMDVGALASGKIDTTAVLAWVTAESPTASAYLRQGWDQTGAARHYLQTSSALQPVVVSAGVPVTLGACWAAEFDGGDDIMTAELMTNFSRAASALTLAAVVRKIAGGGTTQYLISHDTATASARAVLALSANSAGAVGSVARRLDADASASLMSAALAAGFDARLISRIRYADGAQDLTVNGTTVTGALPSAGLSTDTASSVAPAIGARGTAAYTKARVSAVLQARAALDIGTVDAALAAALA